MSKTSNDKKHDEEIDDNTYGATADALGLKKEDLKWVDFEATPEVEAELTELKDEVEKSRDKMMRAMAEVENIRRIAQRDVANAHRYGAEKIIVELMPVLDSLEQGLAAAQGDSEIMIALRNGMELTHRMFYGTLEKFGIKAINPQDEAFDPHQHEAMMTQVDADVPPNTVLTVVQKGYRLHDRILRPARVIVSKAVEK
jgi:molecular chaperone GrpE